MGVVVATKGNFKAASLEISLRVGFVLPHEYFSSWDIIKSTSSGVFFV